ncbi:hypothetical protein GGS24DRAFT_296452 [Hypoxylon argillaceum]|nr:hypothetical protein GGS24DRAFT_296452 [Hypoxylon argillaceum]
MWPVDEVLWRTSGSGFRDDDSKGLLLTILATLVVNSLYVQRHSSNDEDRQPCTYYIYISNNKPTYLLPRPRIRKTKKTEKKKRKKKKKSQNGRAVEVLMRNPIYIPTSLLVTDVTKLFLWGLLGVYGYCEFEVNGHEVWCTYVRLGYFYIHSHL